MIAKLLVTVALSVVVILGISAAVDSFRASLDGISRYEAHP
jgi:hypothetical protein